MSKVLVKNECKDKCVGFSFKMLKPGQSTIVDESKVTSNDMRLIKNGKLASIKSYTGEKIEKSRPVKIDTKIDEPKSKKEEKVDEGEIITPESSIKAEPTETITPESMAKETSEDEPDADEDVEAASEEETETEATKYSEDDLKLLSRSELRKIGTPLGVKGKSVDKLISDILKAQGNE